MVRMRGIKGIRSNRKGSLLDMVFLVIGLLIFGSSVLIGFKVVSEWNDKIAVMDGMPAEAVASTAVLKNHYTGVVDNSFLLLAIGMALAAFVLASLVRVHPIFLPFFLIALVFVIFFAGVFSNIYQGMAETVSLSAEADQLVFINNILTFLPFIVGILGSVLAIVMFKLWSNSQQ
jgi:hypothetical protein